MIGEGREGRVRELLGEVGCRWEGERTLKWMMWLSLVGCCKACVYGKTKKKIISFHNVIRQLVWLERDHEVFRGIHRAPDVLLNEVKF